MDEAFTALRGHARAHTLRLSEVADAVVTGTLPARDLLHPVPAAPTELIHASLIRDLPRDELAARGPGSVTGAAPTLLATCASRSSSEVDQ